MAACWISSIPDLPPSFRVWLQLENEKPAHEYTNPHMEFITQHSQFQLHGDAELAIFACKRKEFDHPSWMFAASVAINCDQDHVARGWFSRMYSRAEEEDVQGSTDNQPTRLSELMNQFGRGWLAFRETELRADANGKLMAPFSHYDDVSESVKAYIAENCCNNVWQLWFPTSESVTGRLLECCSIRSDGNTFVFSAKSEKFVYAFCFLTS